MDTLLFNNINSFKIGNEDANIYIGDKLISRFRQVEYISSTYSGHQYIDLGCYLMSNTDDIQIDIKFNIKGKGFEVDKQATLINQQTDTSPYPGFVLRHLFDDNNDTVEFIAKWKFDNNSYAGKDSRYYFKGLSYPNGNALVQINNNLANTIIETSISLTNIPESQINNIQTTVFCSTNSSGNRFRWVEADLYYLKITKGGQVIRDLIPVYDQVSKEYGLYDKQNKVFYKSQGDESFIGPA